MKYSRADHQQKAIAAAAGELMQHTCRHDHDEIAMTYLLLATA